MTEEAALTVQSSGTIFHMRVPKVVKWTPKEDITAFELALAIPILLSVGRGYINYWEDHVAALPEEVQRHFTIVD